uniref:RING-type E3 ubiquitin transferase n=1 Tax=Anopheles merus TaxID=30066 RepID=A0A182UQ21_ANOME
MDDYSSEPDARSDDSSDQAESAEAPGNYNNIQELDPTDLDHAEQDAECFATDDPEVPFEMCRQCGAYCLDPTDEGQRQIHHAHCSLEQQLRNDHLLELDISRDKTCYICLEVVMKKAARKRRFGILPNCSHTFCLSCIRLWRKSDKDRVRRACPVCRVRSNFVFPSYFWIEDEAAKQQVIQDYKHGCSLTDCKHFGKGAGVCPFGSKCFYRHALPSGELVAKSKPNRKARRKRWPAAEPEAFAPAGMLWQQYDDGLSTDANMPTFLKCDLCDKFCLAVGDNDQNRRHKARCTSAQVQEIDKVFSRKKTCDICLEVVLEKNPPAERRFGILPKCKHTFCVSCIKTWRSTTEYPDTVRKGCPICRVHSSFFFPCKVWAEDEQEKKRLYAIHRSFLKKIDCKRYNRGAGACPFG